MPRPGSRAWHYIVRHVINTHYEPSSIELTGILWRGDSNICRHLLWILLSSRHRMPLNTMNKGVDNVW